MSGRGKKARGLEPVRGKSDVSEDSERSAVGRKKTKECVHLFKRPGGR